MKVGTDLYNWIKRQLGDPVVKVSLTQDMFNDAVNEALEQLNRFKPRRIVVIIPVTRSVKKYDLPTDPEVKAVVDVNFDVPTLQAFANLALDNYADFLYLYDVQYYANLQTWYKGMSRILGVETQWRFDKESYALYIDDVPSTASQAAVLYLADHKIENNDELNTIEANDEVLFKRLVLALCKKIEGKIRGKYGVIPSPAGPIQLNAAELTAEGEREEDEILRHWMGVSYEFVPSWD